MGAGPTGWPDQGARLAARRRPSLPRQGGAARDLALVLADGGNWLSDLAVLRDWPELFGPVASTPTA